MLQTNVGDHPSIISVEEDVKRCFYFLAPEAPSRGQSN
jgi:hypothetical protein